MRSARLTRAARAFRPRKAQAQQYLIQGEICECLNNRWFDCLCCETKCIAEPTLFSGMPLDLALDLATRSGDQSASPNCGAEVVAAVNVRRMSRRWRLHRLWNGLRQFVTNLGRRFNGARALGLPPHRLETCRPSIDALPIDKMCDIVGLCVCRRRRAVMTFTPLLTSQAARCSRW